MYCKRVVCFVFFFLIILSTNVYSVGIGSYGSPKILTFTPGAEYSFRFYVFDSPNIYVGLEGDLAQYTTLIDPNPNGPSRNVEIQLKMPDYLEPGYHGLELSVGEFSTEGASVGGVASVRERLNVFALYPDKHPVFNSITLKDVNVNEKTTLSLNVVNQGEELIDSASGTITLYNLENQILAVLKTESKSIKSNSGESLNAILDAALYNLTPGKYKVDGRVTYDNIDMPDVKENSLIVGELKVNIVDSTKELIVNATNKYYLTLESEWSGDITDVYARIKNAKGKSIKTPNIDLIKPDQGRKAAGVIEAYLETDGLKLGEQDLEVTLYYKDLVTTEIVKVNIIDGIPPIIDEPSVITPKIVFIGVSAIVVLCIIIYFLIFRKSGGKAQSNSGTNNTSYNTNNIRPPSL